MRSLRNQRGFTLVEVVVAFFVFALAAAAVYEVLFGAMRRSVQSANQVEAWLVAQSIRDEQVSRPAPWSEQSKGLIEGGWNWSASTRAREGEEFGRAELAAYDLTIEVSRSGGRRPLATLYSVELARRQ